VLNSDAEYYGGGGVGNYGGADAQPMPYEEYHQSLTLTLPPLAMLVFKPE
jgi:1,4-alpha-glucan branching enzyme